MLMMALLWFGSFLSYAAEEEAEQPSESEYVVSHSLGMSESLGLFGIYTRTWAREYGKNDLYLVLGTSVFFGGGGVGVKHDFRDSWFTPYVSATTGVDYILPMMCQNCAGVDLKMFLNGSMGLELRTTRTENFNVHLQAGVWTGYLLSEGEVFESPSDRPLIWPVLNVKMSHKAN